MSSSKLSTGCTSAQEVVEMIVQVWVFTVESFVEIIKSIKIKNMSKRIHPRFLVIKFIIEKDNM
jgi:hypothetical protein